jgi:hypothetical protein
MKILSSLNLKKRWKHYKDLMTKGKQYGIGAEIHLQHGI